MDLVQVTATQLEAPWLLSPELAITGCERRCRLHFFDHADLFWHWLTSFDLLVRW
jgi:hypothetical protein